MADTVRTIAVWQTEDETKALAENEWNFNIAHGVLKSGHSKSSHPIFNLVWQSKQPAPLSVVSWMSVYGLNWTTSIPAEGETVSIGGKWQHCEPGQVFDLNKEGFFEPSKEPPHPEFLKVGKVHFKHPNVVGIQLVVGIRNDKGQFQPIFIDPTHLPPNSSAVFKPHNQVRWWYEGETKTSTVISKDVTEVQDLDFTKPSPKGKYYYSTHFSFETGKWSISDDEPEQ